MGTSGELVTAVAASLDVTRLGMKRESVNIAMRELRASGMIPVEGRGRSGAAMGPSEAAKLMIAVAGAMQLKDSAETVEQFWRLPLLPSPKDWSRSAGRLASEAKAMLYHIHVVEELHKRSPRFGFDGARPTFGEVLELVLQRAQARTLFFKVGPEDLVEGGPEKLDRPNPFLRVTLDRPTPKATVLWGVLPYTFDELEFGLDRDDEPFPVRLSYADRLSQSRTFGQHAVESVGLFLQYSSEREAKREQYAARRAQTS